jgi:hypothetical protein
MKVCKRHHLTILERLACAVGKGLIAGAVGAGAITLAQALEMRITGRRPMSAPAQATAKLLGIQPDSEMSQRKFAMLIHFIYGIAFGLARTLMRLIGLRGKVASTLHWVALTATTFHLLPYLRLAPPLKEWGTQKIATEALLNIPYAVMAGLTYDRITGRRKRVCVKKEVEVCPAEKKKVRA